MSAMAENHAISLESTFKIHSDYTYKDIDGQVVVLNLKTGDYYTFNGVASVMWRELANGKNTNEVVRIVAESFDAPEAKILSDAKEFIAKILGEGLFIPQEQ